MTSAIGTAFEVTSGWALDSRDPPSTDELDGAAELACREGGGVEIALWWNRVTDELKVSVHEHTSGTAFDIPAERHDALEVFNHPYAHARQILDREPGADEGRVR
jgi:hypothetical protein